MLKHPGITTKRVQQAFDRLKALLYHESQPLPLQHWAVGGEPVPHEVALKANYNDFPPRGKWGPGWDTAWFHAKGTVPAEWEGRHVVARLAFSPAIHEGFGLEALVWKDGEPILALNTYRDAIPIAKVAKAGEAFEFYIEAAANITSGGDDGRDVILGLDPESEPVAEVSRSELACFDSEAWDLYHDFGVCLGAMKAQPDDTPRKGQLLHALNEATNIFDVEGRKGFSRMRSILKGLLEKRNGDTVHRTSAVGHAHIDTAWLWPLRETMRKCARTFSTALSYMEDYPEYVFVCSQAVQYAWMKERYPSIYEGMRKAIQRGQWEPVGSMWVEPDTNVPSGESLVRQILHGKRYFMEEFGYETKDVWLPDVFGYSAAFPQIMKKSCVDYFLTQKISWSQFNRFPHHTFEWQGIDGTRIFTHFPPADTYNGSFEPEELKKGEKRFLDHDRSSRSLYVYGWGDGGGGPTRQMLEYARRMRNFDGIPPVEQEKALDFFKKTEKEATDLPRWVGELYLELHRGTYTTHSKVKRGNRKGEEALRQAEFLDAASFLLHGDEGESITAQAPERATYDVTEKRDGDARNGRSGALDRAWKLLLLNQFHDIIPGSSINWVYRDSHADYATIQTLAGQVRDNALSPLAGALSTGEAEKPLLVSNATGLDRAEVVDGPEGQPLYLSAPSYGYAVGDAANASLPGDITPVRVRREDGSLTLANGLVEVVIDSDGLLTSVLDLEAEREIVPEGQRGNVLHLHPDYPSNWEAWDVDVYYKEAVTEIATAESVEIVEETPLRAKVRVVRRFGKSIFTQDIVLRAGSARIDFVTHVDWQERKRFLKVAFPVDIHAQRAQYEIQYGFIERPNHVNTSWDVARFEVAAQRWADLSEGDYGVALLNDCKYGYDIQDNVMRLSLLRGPEAPDPQADIGEHDFTYSLLPHEGGLRRGGVIEEGEILNQPLLVQELPKNANGSQPAHKSFVSVDREGVVISAVKLTEDGDALIVRCYEAWGTRGTCRLSCGLPVKSASISDLLERPQKDLPLQDGSVEIAINPFEVVTVRFEI